LCFKLVRTEMQPIIIIVADGYSDWEIAPLAGVGRAFYDAEVHFASPEGGPITSVAGLTVSETDKFDAAGDGVVVVCGGSAYEGDADAVPNLSDRLKDAHGGGRVVAGICGGTIALARAGLLDNVKHTSNGPDYLRKFVNTYSGASNYVDQPVALRDGNIITAAAPMPATFAMEVLAAAGLDTKRAAEIPAMLSREHAANFSKA
jgi:putative intracellular protease/amidase